MKSRSRLRTMLLTSVFCVFLARPASGSAPLESVVIDFESYPTGNIDGTRAWQVDAGVAEVVAGEGSAGSRGLILAAGSSEAEVVVPWNLKGASSATLGFSLSGVKAVSSPVSREFMNLAGAIAAVVKESDTIGRLWVLDGHASSPVWIPTGSTVPLDAEGGVAGWVTVSVSLDLLRSTWSLRVGDAAPESNLGPVTDAGRGLSCRFYGYADKTWRLDDLGLSMPIASPADPSSGAGAAGSSGVKSTSTSTAAVIGSGASSVVTSGPTSSSVGAPVLGALSGSSSVIYVDAAHGNDNSDGSIGHPVATLRAAFALVNPVGAEVHATAGTYRLETKLFPAVKFVAEGRVEIK